MSIQSSINQNLSLAGYFALNSPALAKRAKITQARQRYEQATNTANEALDQAELMTMPNKEGELTTKEDREAAFEIASTAFDERVAAATDLRKIDPSYENLKAERLTIADRKSGKQDVEDFREQVDKLEESKSEQMRKKAMQHLKEKQYALAPERIVPPEPEKIAPEGILKGQKQYTLKEEGGKLVKYE